MTTGFAGGQRIDSLDLVRGIAVMGILSVNIVDFALGMQVYLNPAARGWPDPASLFVWATNMVLVDGKFRALFSMLFGASMLLVVERAEAKGEGGWSIHWRRMAVLFVIGLLHNILVWDGDILTLYAMSGLILYRARNRDVRSLVRRGSIYLAISMIAFIAIGFAMSMLDQLVHSGKASADQIKQYNGMAIGIYPTDAAWAKQVALHGGSWADLTLHKLKNAPGVIVQNLIMMFETVGLMMIGMAAYKSGLLTGRWDNARLMRFAAWSIPLGIAAHALLVFVDLRSDFYFAYVMAGFQGAMTPFRVVQALGYAAVVVVLGRSMGPIAQRVAAVGRAAFSNYLGTSFICTFIFYGWGLNQFGTWTRAEAWLVAPAIWALMLLWSKPWLQTHRFGPFEWLWRTLARGRVQPFRKTSEVTA